MDYDGGGGQNHTPPTVGAIIGGRGYFSSGGDFDLKTAFYGLVLLNMT